MKLVDVGSGTLYQVLVLPYCDNTPFTIYLVDQVYLFRSGTLYHISDLHCCDKTFLTEQMCSRRFIGSAKHYYFKMPYIIDKRYYLY